MPFIPMSRLMGLRPPPQSGIPLRDLLANPQRSGSVADIERNLTPQEMAIVNYHRSTVSSGNTGRDEAGRPVTVYSTTIEIPDGPLKGKFVTVPGYFDGAVHTDDDAIYSKWRDEIAAGRWPVYANSRAADARAKYIHGIMDAEPE